MNSPSDDFYSSPAQLAFSNTSIRQRTQQACAKCRERKTKCSGEKPVCKRCTTRGLICQYNARETRPRGTVHSLRNSVSSIELRGDSQAQAYQMHREKQREREYYQYMRHNSSNIVPYELASQAPGIHQLRNEPHLATSSHVPFQSHSQPPSLAGSPIYSSFSPLQSEFSPTSSEESSVMFPDHGPPFSSFPSAHHQIRRTHSQSALPRYYPESQFQPFTTPGNVDHALHHARSLEMFDNTVLQPYSVTTDRRMYGNPSPSYPPPMFLQEAPLPRSPFSGHSDTVPFTSGSLDCDSIPKTPPAPPVIYNPTPSLPLLFQNINLLGMKAEQDDYDTVSVVRTSIDEGGSDYY